MFERVNEYELRPLGSVVGNKRSKIKNRGI